MREICLSGSEGGGAETNPRSLPLYLLTSNWLIVMKILSFGAGTGGWSVTSALGRRAVRSPVR
jgi:hypothetical protein